MALIICPECKKEISDKNTQCIYCGYPLINTKCFINDVEYDFSEELPIALLPNDDYYPAIGAIRRKTSLTLADGCDLVEIIRETKSIPNKFSPKYPLENRSKYKNQNKPTVTCPYCQSADTKKITNMSKAIHTSIFGIFSMGRNSKNYHCDHCGSDF